MLILEPHRHPLAPCFRRSGAPDGEECWSLIWQRQKGLLLSLMAEKSLIYPANDSASSDDPYDPNGVSRLDRYYATAC
jgi:hypothetical protein